MTNEAKSQHSVPGPPMPNFADCHLGHGSELRNELVSCEASTLNHCIPGLTCHERTFSAITVNSIMYRFSDLTITIINNYYAITFFYLPFSRLQQSVDHSIVDD